MEIWREYQEEVAEFFRAAGMDAETDVPIKGARTSHNVDVLVKSEYMGIEVTWLVECKRWNSAIPKEKIFALRSIVEDVGADRGFVMAENGFQSGALEASLLTNITLTSLGEMKERLRFEMSRADAVRVLGQVDECRKRFWEIDKQDRIDYGLRSDITDGQFYNAARVLDAIEIVVIQAALHGFPVAYHETLLAISAFGGGRTARPSGLEGELVFENPEGLFAMIAEKLSDIDRRLGVAERANSSDGI